jgi:signal peptidase I
VWVPKAGESIELNDFNVAMYGRCIAVYEGHNLEERDGKYFIDGVEATEYRFEQDYYFMMGDNRHGSLDSRFWGFVPEDHVVGTPMFVIISFDKDKSLFDGGIRWNRIFADANPDK